MSESENLETTESIDEIEAADEGENVEESSTTKPARSLSGYLIVAITALSIFGYSVISDLQEQVEELKSGVTSVSKEKPNLFLDPENPEKLIANVKKSTVTVYCEYAAGSGWVIDLLEDPDSPDDDAYPVEIITNHHVIEDCVDGAPIYFVKDGSETLHEALLYSYDVKEDMAMLMTDVDIPYLKIATENSKPVPGHWVMAVGSPGVETGFDLAGSVTFGHVTNIDGYVIVTDAAINPGNSGGPLINSRGQVIGTNSWGEDVESWDNIGYSQGIPVLCRKLVLCEDFGWSI